MPIIVIPVYKNELSEEEQKSLSQCKAVLSAYTICLVKPDSLQLSGVLLDESFEVHSFEDRFFQGIQGYNELLHSTFFYERFAQHDYMLIYQLDAYVFSDQLDYWCTKGYDYIGAPWIASPRTWWNKLLLKTKSKKKQERASIFFKVGNGGLSLRKISTFINVCHQFPEKIKENLQRPYGDFRLMEDVFWSIQVPEFVPDFKVPDYNVALGFAFDRKPHLALELNNGKLPFGCHGFYKPKVKAFWEKYIH